MRYGTRTGSYDIVWTYFAEVRGFDVNHRGEGYVVLSLFWLVRKVGSFDLDRDVWGKFVIVTLSGSSTTMVRGAVTFRTSRTQASSSCGSTAISAIVTPSYKKQNSLKTLQTNVNLKFNSTRKLSK